MSKNLTSRERINMALNHQEADRIPIDFGGTDTSTIMVGPYIELSKALGIDPKPIYMPCPTGGTVDVAPVITEAMGGDVRLITAQPAAWRDALAYNGTAVKVPHGFQPQGMPDGSKVIRNQDGDIALQRPADSGFFFNVYHPLAAAADTSLIQLKSDVFNRIDRPSFSDLPIETFSRNIRDQRQRTDKVFVGGFGGHIFEAAMELRGPSSFLMDLIESPKLAEAILDRITEAHMQAFSDYAAYVGPYLDVVQILDDLGTQDAPWLRPEMYRRLVKPYHAKFIAHIKNVCQAAVMFHSDGAIYDLIPDLIEMGVDILNPVQYSAQGMDLKRLKQDFGDDITFWGGGIDTQHAIRFKPPAKIVDEVKRNIDILAPGGGFVFATVHNILEGVPVENILTVFQTARTYSRY